MIWTPTTNYRWDFKRPMQGSDVAALQVNLDGVVVDGRFGRKTEQAVKDFQKSKGLEDDGVAGLLTQRALCMFHSRKVLENDDLPRGMAKSVLSSESGFRVAAVTRHPSDNGLDIGAWQLSTGAGEGSQDFYQLAFDIERAAVSAIEGIRDAYDSIPANPVPSRYLDELADGNKERFRWQMAVLSHNWPDAAEDIPRYGLVYEFDFGRDDQPADWIIQASGGALETPREWVAMQVERKTVYVRW